MTKREVMQQALDALEAESSIYMDNDPEDGPPESIADAIRTLKAELAKPEPEPVAWMVSSGEIWNTPTCPYINEVGVPLYRKEDL